MRNLWLPMALHTQMTRRGLLELPATDMISSVYLPFLR
jgi:hypothetical protein